jgi:protoporphyrinogen oxidase
MLGMTLARELAQQNAQVTILEAAPSTGGLASAARHGPFLWDRFYHVILMSDAHLLGLLDELGLRERLHWGVTRTGFFTDGQMHSLSSSVEFALFPPLSLVDKARLAATIVHASRVTNWQALEEVTAAEWLTRRSGRRVYERIWAPLLRAKLGDNAEQASAAFIWAIIQRMYAARRSGLKREMFGYVDGGYALVLERLQADLTHRGIETLTGQQVTDVRQRERGASVRTADGIERVFDHVVLTVPCGRVAAMVPGLQEAEKRRLRSVVYQGIVCASVLMRRPLANFYVTNITDSWAPFTGVIELTALVNRDEFGGNSLAYLPRYLSQEDPFWQRSNEEIEAVFLDGLERMYPEFRRNDVLAFTVARAREVLALSTLRYSRERLPPLRTSLPDISVVNSSQIAQGTLNVNETVGLAHAQAEALRPTLVALAGRALAPLGAG